MKFKTYKTIGSVLTWLSIISLAIGIISILALQKQMPLFIALAICAVTFWFVVVGDIKNRGKDDEGD